MSVEIINPFYAGRSGKASSDARSERKNAIYVKLPRAPIYASPVPHLTSLYHSSEAGNYGDRSYPGNCGGNLIKDLLRFYGARSVIDPMTGSGTCRDVCRELGLACHSSDLRNGTDACDPESFAAGQFDFAWLHPPYWRQKLYTADRRDLSREPTLEAFLDRYRQLIAVAAGTLVSGGRLAILMGDYQDRDAGFVPLVYHTKRLAFELCSRNRGERRWCLQCGTCAISGLRGLREGGYRFFLRISGAGIRR